MNTLQGEVANLKTAHFELTQERSQLIAKGEADKRELSHANAKVTKLEHDARRALTKVQKYKVELIE